MAPTFGEEVTPVADPAFPTIPAPAPALEIPNRWIPSPALRGYLYGVALAVVPLLTGIGLFTPEVAQNVLNIVAAVLAVGGIGLAFANRPKLTAGDFPGKSVADAAETVDHALVVGDVKPVD